MKKILSMLLICVLSMSTAAPAFADSYVFSSGEDTLPGFGKPTKYDSFITTDPLSDNIRKNKDAAHLPPPYFYGGGDIPTAPSSLYHDNIPGNTGGNASIPGQQSIIGNAHPYVKVNTEPLYYAGGTIGTLYIGKTKKTIKVYEGEQLDNLKKGAGHFSMTSAWDGNAGLCGHNRGANAYFSFVKDLKTGDRVTYTTLYGSRTYEVFSKEQIGEYDYSKLGWSAENILTLVTCIENTPELRWAAQLKEVR